jgi:hypothetical protein
MSRRRTPVPHTDPSAAWERLTHHVSASGRHLGPGTEFSVHGEPGRFRFVEHVITPAGVEWITAHGGPRKVRVCRSFRPERIRRVHTKKTYQSPEEARRLVNLKNRVKRGAE